MEILSTDKVASKSNNLWITGLIALVLSLIASSFIQVVANLILKPDAGFTPLTWGAPQFFTFLALVIATIVYAVVRRSASDPARRFKQIALVVLALTFIPDLALLFVNLYPGTNIGTVGALLLMHLSVWFITVQTLTWKDKSTL